MKAHERIFVALDVPDAIVALDLARALRGRVGGVKIGLELFTSAGPGVVERIRATGLDVFLDLKLHDIPNTVAGAAAAAARLGVAFLSVHALGGHEMIARAAQAASTAARDAGMRPPTLLAVTILTSHDDDGLRRIGVVGPSLEAVTRLAALARDAGAGGVVCSPLEIRGVRAAFPAASVMVPGIRPAHRSAVPGDDQSRTASPADAVRAGADRIVVGRPIIAAADPVVAAEGIAREIEAVAR